MRFALLCDDQSARPLMDALGEHFDQHCLTHAVRVTPQADHLLHLRAGITCVEGYEDLPFEAEIDAVLVGGSDEAILLSAKQLASHGVPILLLPSAQQGSTSIYELSLVRDDNHVTLFPVFWHRYDSAVLGLRQAIKSGRLGPIQFLQLQRTLNQPTPNSLLSQQSVDAELIQDVDLLRWLTGDYDQVTALRTGATTDGVLMQSVVLAGRALPEANWSITSTDGPNQWQLIVRGEASAAQLVRDEHAFCWTSTIAGDSSSGDQTTTARRVLQAFAQAVSEPRDVETTSSPAGGKQWDDLVKSFETVDATHRSVRRRRTIELHFEPMSERAIFKTQMTAIGCSLLTLTFFLALCFLGVASIVPLPEIVLKIMRFLVFAPLGLFLLAQVLLPLTRPSSNEQVAEKDKAASNDRNDLDHHEEFQLN